MTSKTKTAPLFYTLVQVRFNPIGAMENYVNKIQDKLRLEGYTLFEQQKVTQLQLSRVAPGKADVVEQPLWLMTKSDKTSGFILDQSHLTFHTTHYQGHDEFFEMFTNGLKLVHSVLKLEHVSRLGLRYLNAVLPKKDKKIQEFLTETVHGINVESSPRYSLYESVFDTRITDTSLPGILVNRIYCKNEPLGYPPDIATPNLVLNKQFKEISIDKHAVLDIDHFIEMQIPLDFEQLLNQLNCLHLKISEAFRASVTSYALNFWGIS